MELVVGAVYQGKVTTITKFGAFVSLPNGKSGLVHISEVSNGYVNDVHDFLSEGQEVTVKVLSVMPDGKINLSVKQVQTGNAQRQERTQSQQTVRPQPQQLQKNTRSSEEMIPPQESSFEDKLKKFMSASEGKMSDLNRHMEGKRRRR